MSLHKTCGPEPFGDLHCQGTPQNAEEIQMAQNGPQIRNQRPRKPLNGTVCGLWGLQKVVEPATTGGSNAPGQPMLRIELPARLGEFEQMLRPRTALPTRCWK